MSGLPHSLTPPADYSKPVLAAAVGVSLALVINSFLVYRLPSPGDNIHQLPFGGSYRDGTKSIHYNSPRAQSQISGASPFLIILILSALIYALSCRGGHHRARLHRCPCCS
uniref:TGB2 n=2 Tax=Potexvirus alternantherae TaxID=85454 RepID=Q52Z63_9VIRU|nr:triple gene block 2 protein [Alternanthera mosaic virus]AAX86022.1 triple gene block 2 protein [Alternanthera mosaic virus]ACS28230.1 TGB2 [Alternanthera mosaic virus]ACS28235.1 TGB2 [Alternanthera mosaic virus]